MRKIKDIEDIVKEVNSNFPDGAIINETDTQDGTPVIREIYNDPLNNLYKIMRMTGVESNGIEDSETSGFQFVEAVQKLPNLLNDIERVLSYDGINYNVNFDFQYLPNKYVFVARVDSNFVSGKNIKGTGVTTYPLQSVSGFSASDEVLVILDQSEARVYSLTKNVAEEDNDTLFLSLGQPIQYNDTDVLTYQEDGYIFNDTPSSVYLEGLIRVAASDGTLILLETLFMQGVVICFCFSPSLQNYKSYVMSREFDQITLLTGSVFDASVNDYKPNIFTNQFSICFTNQSNQSGSDNIISIYSLSIPTATITLTSTVSIDASYVKTTNMAVVNLILYTLVDGYLKGFNLSTGNVTDLGKYDSVIGNIFIHFGQLYFSSGEIAKKWIL